MRWPFFRKAAAPAAPLRRWALPGGGGEVPQGYEAQLRAGYGRNAIAQRAVRMVAEAAASAPLMVDGVDHPCIALVAGELVETLATQLLLHGNAFVETGLNHAGMPAALWALRPERMTLETDVAGWPKTWLYRAGGSIARYAAEGDAAAPGLLHLKMVNPLDDHFGMGCLGAASDAVALLNRAAAWNAALLDNAARPSGALLLDGKDGWLSPEQVDRLRDELERAFQGAANAGRPMLLEGGLRWQAMAMTPAEMDFARAREAAAREVALAFGVPPMLLGLPGDATYANYAQANVALWRLTVLPLLGKILRRLSGHLGLWWPGVQLSVDLDAVPALWSDRESLWRHVGAADFLSRDEKRALLGWGAEA
ncbi:phage portal protein [Sandaracinobacteroides saxicola]|uniref:Phage portal protein n=1 Tax=Sandaracinobacteroides saxicola TaxID=2759707 RepID=A0A7G5IJ35_9SPHN|nr:phage portal protein [Sandaracinobacteroides saxicola]QMW23377.1 phage portal protein [Sandaracinobacteroides saxicola]